MAPSQDRCEACSADFAVSHFKRNCDLCGKRCCSNCIVGKNRICQDCIANQVSGRTLSLEEDLHVNENINNLLKQDLKHKAEQLDRCRQYLLEFDSLFVNDVIGDKTHLLMKVNFNDENCNIDDIIEKSTNNIRIVADELKSLSEAREASVAQISQLKSKISQLELENQDLSDKLKNSVDLNSSFEFVDDFELSILKNELEAYKTRCELLESKFVSNSPVQSSAGNGVYVITPEPTNTGRFCFCFRCPFLE